jgi:hypothetical protein
MRSLMASGLILALAVPASMPGGTAQVPQGQQAVSGKPGPVLRRFASDQAFRRYIRQFGARQRFSVAEPMALPAPAMVESSAVAADAAAPANPEITNNQTVGVDEGGIVKQIGRFLVVLQDARVFAIDLGTGPKPEMRLTDRFDVYRNAKVAASWYDEMLVLGDRILITAYNYAENASEVTVLRLGPEGRIRREGRYLLSSSDYYSTDNYATRLVGDTLVFYAPFDLSWGGGRFEWPRLRRAHGDGEADKGKAMLRATDIYAPAGKVEHPVLHTVSVCPLRAGMECRTTGFIGPWMREFYVSPTDAYVWIGAPDGLPWGIEYGNQRRKACASGHYWRGRSEDAALLYRLPLAGGPIGAIAAEGVPADQFAFEAKDGRFRALLARHEPGCFSGGERAPLTLMDVPLSAFGPAVRHVAERAYTTLPSIEGGQLENRFVGNWLVYGGRDGWAGLTPDTRALASTLFAAPLNDPRAVRRLRIPHNAIRIERAGSDAVVTGYRNADGLSLSYVRLGSEPDIASTALLRGRFESEGRSHAFNAWIRRDGSGLIGIPTSQREWRAGRGWSDSNSSELSFIAVDTAKKLDPAGELAPGDAKVASDYKCEVSCIDWYGNSRPIFTGGRIFALMGTSLVEGEMRRGRIAERGRVDLTRRIR